MKEPVFEKGYPSYDAVNRADSSSREYMISELQKRVCRVIFKKVNGEERDMMCTLIEDVLPEMKGTERQKSKEVIRAFDTLKGEFRAFRVENVISFT